MRLLTQKRQKHGSSSVTHLLWQTATQNLVESSILYIHEREIPWVFCFPSSVGCSLGCLICAMPRERSPNFLERHELSKIFEYSMGQVENIQCFQVSFMGQGEPLLNVDNIFEFCSNLCHIYPEVMIGISTVGIAEGIKALSNEEWAAHVKLQISLHCWPPRKRKKIVPAENQYPVEQAISEAARFGTKWRRQVALNCVLVEGVNDSLEDAQSIAEIAASGPFYVKVSEFNPPEYCHLKPASKKKTREYCEKIRENNVEVHKFKSIGTSIGAGCGQTKLSYEKSVRFIEQHAKEVVNV